MCRFFSPQKAVRVFNRHAGTNDRLLAAGEQKPCEQKHGKAKQCEVMITVPSTVLNVLPLDPWASTLRLLSPRYRKSGWAQSLTCWMTVCSIPLTGGHEGLAGQKNNHLPLSLQRKKTKGVDRAALVDDNLRTRMCKQANIVFAVDVFFFWTTTAHILFQERGTIFS